MSTSSQYLVNFFPFCKIKQLSLDFFQTNAPFGLKFQAKASFLKIIWVNESNEITVEGQGHC